LADGGPPGGGSKAAVKAPRRNMGAGKQEATSHGENSRSSSRYRLLVRESVGPSNQQSHHNHGPGPSVVPPIPMVGTTPGMVPAETKSGARVVGGMLEEESLSVNIYCNCVYLGATHHQPPPM